jgi:PST family polysaccharide transporter
LAAWFLDPGNRLLITIVFLMSFASISQALDVIDYFFQARTQSRSVVVPRTVAFIVGSLARLAAVYFRMGVLMFAYISAFEILFGELGLAVAYFRSGRIITLWNWHLPRAKSLLVESWPLLLSSVLTLLYMRTDQILLGRLSSARTLGQYTAAVRLSEVWYTIPMVVCASVMPRMLASRDADKALYYKRLQLLYESMALISILAATAVQFTGSLAVRLLYGQAFAPAAKMLSVHIWTGVFVFVGCVGGQQLVQEKLTMNTMYRTAAGALINVILNLLWIPRWGGVGSAMATLAAQFTASYLYDAFDRRTWHIFAMKSRAYAGCWMLPYHLMQKGQVLPD